MRERIDRQEKHGVRFLKAQYIRETSFAVVGDIADLQRAESLLLRPADIISPRTQMQQRQIQSLLVKCLHQTLKMMHAPCPIIKTKNLFSGLIAGHGVDFLVALKSACQGKPRADTLAYFPLTDLSLVSVLNFTVRVSGLQEPSIVVHKRSNAVLI